MDKLYNTFRYLDDVLALHNLEFQKFGKNFILNLPLNKSKISNDRTPFLDLDLNIEQGCLYTKIYNKKGYLFFLIVNFSFLEERACTKRSDFHDRNLHLTAKLLQQGYRYHKLRKTFTKSYVLWKYYI